MAVVVAVGGVGAGTTYVKFPPGDGAELPPGVVTVIGTVFLPGGLVASNSVADTILIDVDAPAAPKLTPVAPLRLVPVIDTTVPPVVGPDPGAMLFSTGAGGVGGVPV